MKLCIPTIDPSGLEAMISPHFGSATFYTLIEPETGEVAVVPNESHDPGHHSCAAPERLREIGAEAVLCHGLGRRAYARFAAAGIPVFTTSAAGVRGAVEAFAAGQLARLTQDGACGGGRNDGCSH